MVSINKKDFKNIEPLPQKRIGWIGTGVMGLPMCNFLIDARYPTYIYNRTQEKCQVLLDKGAIWCESPKELARLTDIIITIVGFPEDVNEVYFGEEGLFQGITEGKILIDMTTSMPSLAQQIFQAAQLKRAHALDAPVSGGDIGARDGTLAIMVGGEKSIYEKVYPIFQLFGKNISFMGRAGSGQHTKMSNQILIASTMVGVVESLMYAYKAGIDLNEIIDVISKGAAASWSFNNLGRRIVNKDFNPGFFIKHFIKDMGVALAEAKRMKLSLPGLSLAYQFYIAAEALGFENFGTQALYKVFEKINNV